MRLIYASEVEAFRAEFSAWLDANLPDPASTTVRPRSSGDIPAWAREFQRRMFDDGWLVPGYPPEFGGRNASLYEQAVYWEELGRRRVTQSFNPQGLGIVSASIITFGTEEQKHRWAVPIMRAERTAALGMSEPGAGSDLAGLSTRAVLNGDHFIVNGQKVWTSGAHHADVLLAFVRTDPDVPKHKGISALIIETDTPGLERRPFQDITARQPDFNEVFFDDVEVPVENLVGELNDGWRVCTGSLAHEREMLWILWSQGLDQMLDAMLSQLNDGAGAGAADDPVVLDGLGSSIMDSWALRLLGQRQLARSQRGLHVADQSLLKLLGSEAQQKLALLMLESLGPAALDRTVPEGAQSPYESDRSALSWADRYWFTFAGTISGGTSEIHRNIIAERVLGQPRG
ncbi:MAG: acyl-CoA dehydrogenase family protein [Acidimicrobiaceae bacterium]|nr:acyl-CoA dehydrogenase family protein [Acidimicrobiaceae bacterium]MDE0514757.1 acyl-CoA dehydrogenase family protein [Acidimicrobiaceae bacterium]